MSPPGRDVGAGVSDAPAVAGNDAGPGAGRPAVPPTAARSPWKAVAVPTEHGGWGLTLEPCLLGLLVAPSLAGAALAAATFLAFLVRTPLKLALVDRRRGRRLARTRLATRIAAVEALGLVALAGTATVRAGPSIWLPVLAALPFVGVEAWYEVRSRGRRLVPELAGGIGVSAAAAAIALAGGASAALAVGLWLVLAGRCATSIPQVRAQVLALHGRTVPAGSTAAGDLAALGLGVVAVVLDAALLAGAVTLLVIVAVQRVLARRPAPDAKVVGLRQLGLGLALVAATAAGALLT
ncbi:MAG: YwiC-like family protein [Acidimicrobiales bacterium]|nr:YwiC-like family protein [Acidimicrobiales bacterium]MCB9371559.1 YwiC-like family protein [Microthrixaceae bacterium]